MEVKNAKGGTYPLALFVILMLLLNTYCFDAAFLVKSNTTVSCDVRLDECLIEDDLEFLINPYMSRVLAGTGKSVGEIAAPEKPPSPPRIECASNPVCAFTWTKCDRRSNYTRCDHQLFYIQILLLLFFFFRCISFYVCLFPDKYLCDQDYPRVL